MLLFIFTLKTRNFKFFRLFVSNRAVVSRYPSLVSTRADKNLAKQFKRKNKKIKNKKIYQTELYIKHYTPVYNTIYPIIPYYNMIKNAHGNGFRVVPRAGVLI